MLLKKIARYFRWFLNQPILKMLGDYTLPDAASQIALSMSYRQLAALKAPLPTFAEVGFKAYSQTDEDGILLYIFALIGITNKKCVEICAGTGFECNTANLIINHGWTGLLFDGDSELVRNGNLFYRNNLATFVTPPTFVCSWIKRSNVNTLIEENGFKGEVDLLSLDMDGVDYWIWDAIEVINPRVVIVEYQDMITADISVTVPYADDFNWHNYPKDNGFPCFFGASLSAFVKLACKKGYRLIGCNRACFNAFFIRNDVANDLFQEIPATGCFWHPDTVKRITNRWPLAKDLPWEKV